MSAPFPSRKVLFQRCIIISFMQDWLLCLISNITFQQYDSWKQSTLHSVLESCVASLWPAVASGSWLRLQCSHTGGSPLHAGGLHQSIRTSPDTAALPEPLWKILPRLVSKIGARACLETMDFGWFCLVLDVELRLCDIIFKLFSLVQNLKQVLRIGQCTGHMRFAFCKSTTSFSKSIGLSPFEVVLRCLYMSVEWLVLEAVK